MKKTPCFASFSYWGVHWLKLAPELKKVPGGKTTTHNILFEPILPNFEEIFEIGDDDFGGCPTLPVRKTAALFPTTKPTPRWEPEISISSYNTDEKCS